MLAQNFARVAMGNCDYGVVNEQDDRGPGISSSGAELVRCRVFLFESGSAAAFCSWVQAPQAHALGSEPAAGLSIEH